MTEVRCVLDAKARLGECPVWSVAEQVLYWADITGRAIHRFDPGIDQDQAWHFPDDIGSFALRDGGGLIVALGTELYLVDLDTMAVERVGAAATGRSETRFNDGRCDRAGRFWVGTMDLEKRRPIGALCRLDADRRLDEMVGGVIVSNGLAWSPDDRVMYHADSRQDVIWAYDYDLSSGSVANRRVFAEVDPRGGRPDGAGVDADGFYWSTRVGGGRLTRFAPDGRIDREVELPVTYPGMCAFGGPDLDILYVTSVREVLSPAELVREPLAGGILAVEVGVKGVPEPCYRD